MENLPPNPTFQFVWREQLTPTKQIELAKGQTFTVNPADYGLPIHCAVTTTNGAGQATAISPSVVFTSRVAHDRCGCNHRAVTLVAEEQATGFEALVRSLVLLGQQAENGSLKEVRVLFGAF